MEIELIRWFGALILVYSAFHLPAQADETVGEVRAKDVKISEPPAVHIQNTTFKVDKDFEEAFASHRRKLEKAEGASSDKPLLESKPLNGSCTTGGQRQSILGMATMAADGSIVAPIEGPGPMHTKSVVRLKPGDKEYESFLKHIGGLKPGETKPLPVWDTPTKKE